MIKLTIAYCLIAISARIGAHYSHGSLRKQLKTVFNIMFAMLPGAARAVAVKLGWAKAEGQ